MTPFSEAYQALVWHLLVSHPKLKEKETMWESVIAKNKAFFFDRDGIINKSVIKDNKPFPPRYPRDLVLNYELFNFIKNLKKKII